MGRSIQGRLVQRTVAFGQLACVPRATYHREREVHPAFQQTIRLLYSRPTKLSIQAITEHVELKQVALRLRQGKAYIEGPDLLAWEGIYQEFRFTGGETVEVPSGYSWVEACVTRA